MNLRSMNPTTYILLMRCSEWFRLFVLKNHIAIYLLVYERIQCMFVCCVCFLILRCDWDHIT
jgi:hypothetical protein